MVGSIYKKYMWLVSTVNRFGGLTYEEIKAVKRFEGLIGVWNNTGNAPVKVLLKITGYLRDYIATLPLHPSQVLVERGKDYQVYEYLLSPNYELEDALCGFGGCCEVLEPKSLYGKRWEKMGKLLHG